MNRTSKSLCLSLLLLPSCTLSFAQGGLDLTRAGDVLNLQPSSTIKPFRPAPGPTDPRNDGQCFIYGSDSNYHQEEYCSFSPDPCTDACLKSEQICVDNAAAICQSTDNTNGSCFESRSDQCRSQYNSCVASCN